MSCPTRPQPRDRAFKTQCNQFMCVLDCIKVVLFRYLLTLLSLFHISVELIANLLLQFRFQAIELWVLRNSFFKKVRGHRKVE